MATPTISSHVLRGALGEIFVDVRAGGRESARPAVVIIHGFKGFKDWGFFPPLAERLARAGLTAVTFNMSGSGVDASGQSVLPDCFARDTYSAQLADLGTVLESLARGDLGVRPPATLGLVGHSRGGGVAILRAAGDQRVRALVTWAAISVADRWSREVKHAWRERGTMDVANARTGQVIPVTTAILDDLDSHASELDIAAAARRVTAPWLIIHGVEDESVPFAESQRLLEASSGRARVLPVEKSGHTFGAAHPWRPPVPAAERVFGETVAFLSAALL